MQHSLLEENMNGLYWFNENNFLIILLDMQCMSSNIIWKLFSLNQYHHQELFDNPLYFCGQLIPPVATRGSRYHSQCHWHASIKDGFVYARDFSPGAGVQRLYSFVSFAESSGSPSRSRNQQSLTPPAKRKEYDSSPSSVSVNSGRSLSDVGLDTSSPTIQVCRNCLPFFSLYLDF